MPRDLTGITAGSLGRGDIAFYFFVRIDFPGPTGPLRFSTYPGNAPAPNYFLGNIDGTSQTWFTDRPLRLEQINYGRETGLEVSGFSIGNADDWLSDLHNLHGHLRWPISIYRGQFALTTGSVIGALQKVHRIYEGVIDRVALGDISTLSLVPHSIPWSSEFPKGRFDIASGFKKLPPPELTVEWGTVTVTLPSPPSANPNLTFWKDDPRYAYLFK